MSSREALGEAAGLRRLTRNTPRAARGRRDHRTCLRDLFLRGPRGAQRISRPGALCVAALCPRETRLGGVLDFATRILPLASIASARASPPRERAAFTSSPLCPMAGGAVNESRGYRLRGPVFHVKHASYRLLAEASAVVVPTAFSRLNGSRRLAVAELTLGYVSVLHCGTLAPRSTWRQPHVCSARLRDCVMAQPHPVAARSPRRGEGMFHVKHTAPDTPRRDHRRDRPPRRAGALITARRGSTPVTSCVSRETPPHRFPNPDVPRETTPNGEVGVGASA
ncbi:hypothetical protein SAMN05880545_2376 [Microbacterium sp. RU33B]|nr:hypothetical protein SAMN05880545_2376 [Microbacterium sp. RU33B]